MSGDRVAAGLVVAAVVDELAAALVALECPADVTVRGGEGPLGGVVLVVGLAVGDAARLALGLKEWEAANG
ncbi:hypothetical protein [Streptomyces iconiensis]|uniref:Uncharacterized protein n=1 Tax=Streptomyces iconiensis TaxID=1384038 RepID=A0ABT6ZRZ0_9ACTN|nr:hypothetical protein [Streptomyces iconiensis]MDJ1131821.1 hypothetical protein [Streptomyces iconiensis]